MVLERGGFVTLTEPIEARSLVWVKLKVPLFRWVLASPVKETVLDSDEVGVIGPHRHVLRRGVKAGQYR